MMGGKRGYARAILGVLGLRQGLGADEVWLNDAGPWGPVWRVLTTPGKAEEVAAIIRGWKDEEPRALWDRLKAEGWGELTEADQAAAWTLCAAQAWRVGNPDSGYNRHVAEGTNPTKIGNWATFAAETPERVASRVEAVARWLVCQHWSFSGKGVASGYGGPGCVVNAPTANWTTEQRDKALGVERFNGLVLDAAQSLATPCRAFHGSALDVPIPDDCEGVYVYADPSYKHPDGTATTGYAQNIYAEDLRDYLLEWSRRGAVVCISDARPLGSLMGDGWREVRIDSERVGQRRTFSAQSAEWLTLNRAPAWTPSVQVGLFG